MWMRKCKREMDVKTYSAHRKGKGQEDLVFVESDKMDD